MKIIITSLEGIQLTNAQARPHRTETHCFYYKYGEICCTLVHTNALTLHFALEGSYKKSNFFVVRPLREGRNTKKNTFFYFFQIDKNTYFTSTILRLKKFWEIFFSLKSVFGYRL